MLCHERLLPSLHQSWKVLRAYSIDSTGRRDHSSSRSFSSFRQIISTDWTRFFRWSNVQICLAMGAYNLIELYLCFFGHLLPSLIQIVSRRTARSYVHLTTRPGQFSFFALDRSAYLHHFWDRWSSSSLFFFSLRLLLHWGHAQTLSLSSFYAHCRSAYPSHFFFLLEMQPLRVPPRFATSTRGQNLAVLVNIVENL